MSKDSYQVTDEGGGLIRVDAQIRLVRKPIAVAMCDEVDKVVAGYDEFRILMNMSAMSKGTPAAGFFVIRTMKKYPLRALAFFGANSFMRGMATTVLGLARFSNFQIFDDEVAAREWLARGAPQETGSGSGRLRTLGAPVAIMSAVALVVGALRRRRGRFGSSPLG